MQSCQIVPQACIFSFYSCHVGLADKLIALWNELRIDLPPIRDIEVALPHLHHCPQGLEGRCTLIPAHPAEDAALEMIDGCPDPDFVFFSTEAKLAGKVCKLGSEKY